MPGAGITLPNSKTLCWLKNGTPAWACQSTTELLEESWPTEFELNAMGTCMAKARLVERALLPLIRAALVATLQLVPTGAITPLNATRLANCPGVAA